MAVSKKQKQKNRKTKNQRKNSVKVKGRTVNNTQTVYSGFNETASVNNFSSYNGFKRTPKKKYGFESNNLKSSAEIRRLVNSRKSMRPIIRFVDNLKNKIEKMAINPAAIDILVKFLKAIKVKLPRISLTLKQLRDYKARVLIHINNFLKTLQDDKIYSVADINEIKSLIKDIQTKHKLDLKSVKGRASFSIQESNTNTNSNNWQ